MARNVYTVRVVEANDIDYVELEPVPIESQFIISHMTASSIPGSDNWGSFANPVNVVNLSTGCLIWTIQPIPPISLTMFWSGRYVLEYGEQLAIIAPGWDVAVTAYSLALP